MKELIEYLACSLAGRPDEVRVSKSVGENGALLELRVAEEDINQIIGKKGRTARAMRSLLAAACAKKGGRWRLKIVSREEAAPAEAEAP